MKLLRVDPAVGFKGETVCQFVGWPMVPDLHFVGDTLLATADMIETVIHLAQPDEVHIDERGGGAVLIDEMRHRGYVVKGWRDPPTPPAATGGSIRP